MMVFMNMLFSTPIGRLAFLGRYFLAVVLLAIGGLILGIANRNHNVFLMLLSGLLEISGFIYIIGFTMFPRLLSVGLSRWFVLVLLIPVVNLLFMIFLLLCPAGWLIKKDPVA